MNSSVINYQYNYCDMNSTYGGVMKMNQHEYLQELKIGLMRKLPSSEIQDIIEEYQGFFTDGLAEGLSEEAISESLGSPALLVGTLTEDLKDQTLKSQPQKPIDEVISNTIGFISKKVSPPLATIWQRVGASLIDRLFIIFVMFTIIFLFGQISQNAINKINSTGSVTQTKISDHLVEYSTTTVKAVPATGSSITASSLILIVIFLASFIFPQEILGIVLLIVFISMKINVTSVPGSTPRGILSGSLIIPLIILVALLISFYKPIIESIWNGRTIGKRLLGIRVASEDGSRAGVGKIAMRELIGDGLLGSLTGGISTIISIFTVAIGIPHKSVPDYIASTIVVIDNPKAKKV